MAQLSNSEIQNEIKNLPGWQVRGNALEQTFKFPDFVAAIAFVNQLAAMAQEAGHHPDIDIRYNQVMVALSTHDSGGVTRKDTDMAARISEL